ncbi:DUF4336 domain-containing protein [Pseudoalteromonas sp. OOF1S-7]|nr:DUF4336 domain-containing protein [Pseudoalteromonas sp. OOF1S-7]MCG7533934.1 DUF4336 domain-containing protein [Pseudoalteromonas sp. OOF1S-7]
MPFTTRMTIVRLPCGGLWVHSPICLTPGLREQVDALGPVTYLVAPNHLHHLFMAPGRMPTRKHAHLARRRSKISASSSVLVGSWIVSITTLGVTH